MMATVVLNLSGLMSGLLYMFLRSNTATTSFGPKLGRSWDRAKHDIKIFGPNELVFQTHLADPVSGPRSPLELESRTSSTNNLIDMEKAREYSMESIRSPPPVLSPKRYNPLRSNAVSQIRPMPRITEPVVSPKRGHARKQSYSLFPNGTASSDASSPVEQVIGTGRQQIPVSVYDISELGDLEPPPSLFGNKRGHRRDSSAVSSATVQIGLRLSHAPIPSEEDIQALPLPSTTYSGSSTLPLPSTTYKPRGPISPPRSPLRIQTKDIGSQQAIPIPLKSPRRPSPLVTNIQTTSDAPPIQSASMNKTLPATPRPLGSVPTSVFQRLNGSTTQLSPTVYSPGKGASSPLASFQSANNLNRSTSNSSITSIAPPQRSSSNRKPGAMPAKEWI
jgi:hypothetical protein